MHSRPTDPAQLGFGHAWAEDAGEQINARLLMKVGDLVSGKESWIGSVGLITGFDEDDDPIVVWAGIIGSNEIFPGCGEWRRQIKVISEAR